MELNINSPAYYTKIYGVDDEIYWMCRELAQYMKDKDYSESIKIVGIVPIIAPKEVIEKGLCKEVKKVELKSGFASLSLHVNYAKYVVADIYKKKSMIIDNILKSIKTIKSRAKFDYKRFENDIRIFCKNNNIIFNIEKLEEVLFEQSIDISNHLALKDFDYLLNNGYLTELSKSSILSILCDYGGNLSFIDKNKYIGRFYYYMLQDNRYQTEINLIIDDYVSDLTLSCELSVENNKIIGGIIDDIHVL